MKHKRYSRIAAATALFALAAGLFAAQTQVVYVEGKADFKKGGATFKELDFGEILVVGDTVRTGKDGLVSLSQAGVEITVNPNTVFTLQEKEQGGKKLDVLAVTLGSIKMKYDKLTGQEPLLRTASAAAGVRGTELTMFSGPEGSSFIVVDSGSVEVSAEGKSVLLAPGEGVEVKPGSAPGNKFAVQRNQVDYSSWDAARLESLLADPVAAIAALRAQLDSYAKSTAAYYADFTASRQRVDEERAKAVKMIETDGEDAAKKYSRDVLDPLVGLTNNLNLNYRYYALAALSMRRYVVGHVYATLKPLYIANEDDTEYQEFLTGYRDFLDSFEAAIVPRLVEADI